MHSAIQSNLISEGGPQGWWEPRRRLTRLLAGANLGLEGNWPSSSQRGSGRVFELNVRSRFSRIRANSSISG